MQGGCSLPPPVSASVSGRALHTRGPLGAQHRARSVRVLGSWWGEGVRHLSWMTVPRALTRVSPLSDSVPFREAPAYSNRRRRPPSTLAAPRLLLRSNSDNNLHAGAPDWAVCAATSRLSFSPQLLQQTPGKADGAAKTLGSYTPGPRSRSPSLNRLGGAGEDAKRPQQPWHVG